MNNYNFIDKLLFIFLCFFINKLNTIWLLLIKLKSKVQSFLTVHKSNRKSTQNNKKKPKLKAFGFWHTHWFDQLCLGDPLLAAELRPLNPTTLSFDEVGFGVSILLLDDGRLLVFWDAVLDVLFAENLTGFETLTILPVFKGDLLTDAVADGFEIEALAGFWLTFDDFALGLFFGLVTFKTLEFRPLETVCGVVVASLLTLTTFRDSRLSFFLMASSILLARRRSFFETRLVTLPASWRHGNSHNIEQISDINNVFEDCLKV